jgi:hypothetical protein
VPAKPPLTDEQRERLLKFKEQHGPHWKANLKDMWLRGTDASVPDGHLLRQIRNTYGPSWLTNLKL